MYMPLTGAFGREMYPNGFRTPPAPAFNPNKQLNRPFSQQGGPIGQQQFQTPFYNPFSLGSYQSSGGQCQGSCEDPRQTGRQSLPSPDYQNKILSQTEKLILSQLKKNIIQISEELNIGPNWLDLAHDGGAVWKYQQMIQGDSLYCKVFNRVEVNANRVAKTKPIPYVACVTTTTKIKLNPHLVRECLERFPMISYCPTTNSLQITMDSLEHNLAILALICGVQQKKISLWRIRIYDLIKKYLLLTSPGHKKYRPSAKWGLVTFIRK